MKRLHLFCWFAVAVLSLQTLAMTEQDNHQHGKTVQPQQQQLERVSARQQTFIDLLQ